MRSQLFGTDGIRGEANCEPMTAEIALKVAMAAGRQFNSGAQRPLAVIGKDTRLSGYMLEPALTAGLVSVGMDVVLVGPLPTPAIAMLTRSMRADLGIMISASHNPFQDNGIKLFGPDGYKLSDDTEDAIAAMVLGVDPIPLADSPRLGRAKRLDDASGRYIEFVKASFPKHLVLDGLKIAVDCANGAAYKVAPTVLRELGAEVVAIGNAPDGLNINRDCGATHVETLAQTVVTHGCQIGLALDGDADRLIVVDEHGTKVDGDQIMGLIAQSWAASGRLRGGGLVATVMSNLGLERHLRSLGLTLHRTKVGDRYVVETMRDTGINIGGEQSGHIILSDHATTGDGLMAGLQVLAVLVEGGRAASDTCRVFTPLPQVLRNVRYPAEARPLDDAGVQATIAAAERELNGHGRLLVRKSGTEPLIRVMVEAEDDGLMDRLCTRISDAIAQAAI